jgi:hypothetical protein
MTRQLERGIETRRGILIAKDRPLGPASGVGVAVLDWATGQVIRPVPAGGLYWLDKEVSHAGIGCVVEFEIAGTRCGTRAPHVRDDVNCTSLRVVHSINAYGRILDKVARKDPYEVLWPLAKRGLEDLLPFFPHARVPAGVEAPSILIVRGSIERLLTVPRVVCELDLADGRRLHEIRVTSQAPLPREHLFRKGICVLGLARPENPFTDGTKEAAAFVDEDGSTDDDDSVDETREVEDGEEPKAPECAVVLLGFIPPPEARVRIEPFGTLAGNRSKPLLCNF